MYFVRGVLTVYLFIIAHLWHLVNKYFKSIDFINVLCYIYSGEL